MKPRNLHLKDLTVKINKNKVVQAVMTHVISNRSQVAQNTTVITWCHNIIGCIKNTIGSRIHLFSASPLCRQTYSILEAKKQVQKNQWSIHSLQGRGASFISTALISSLRLSTIAPSSTASHSVQIIFFFSFFFFGLLEENTDKDACE